MQFVPLTSLKEISGYRDRRSIKRWIEHSLGIELHRVGKNWCVVKEEFELALSLRFAVKEEIQKPFCYAPANETEQAFLAALDGLLSGKNEV